METQYYTLIEKQDFFEIIENKFGELAIFIDARDGSPVNPVLEFDGKKTALLKRDERLAVRLDNIDEETKGPLAEAEFVLIVELNGKMVERTYGVPVEEIQKAIKLGMDELCFTEHSDYDVPTVVNCDYDAYFEEMEKMKDKYKGQITLKTGIEFGIQTHTTKAYIKSC